MGNGTETFNRAAEKAVAKAVDQTIEKTTKRTGMIVKWIVAPLVAGTSLGGGSVALSKILPAQQPTTDEIKQIIREIVKETAPDPKDITAIKEALLRMEGRQAMADNGNARDKAELQRQIDEVRRTIDNLESKRLADVEQRLRALEAKNK